MTDRSFAQGLDLTITADDGRLCITEWDHLSPSTTLPAFSQLQTFCALSSSHPPACFTFVFNNPPALLRFSQSSAESVLATNRLSNEHAAVPVSAVRRLRVGLLRPLTSSVTLTPEEERGGVGGPFMQGLITEWREAFRMLNKRSPPLLGLEYVEIDVSNERGIEAHHIIRLIQEVCTVMYLQAKIAERNLTFRVSGCGPEKKRWLEAALPALRTC